MIFVGQSRQFVSTSSCRLQFNVPIPLGGGGGNWGKAPTSLLLFTRIVLSAVRALRFGGSAVNEQLAICSVRIDGGSAGMPPPRPLLPSVTKEVSFVSLSSAGSEPVSWLPLKPNSVKLDKVPTCDGTVPVIPDEVNESTVNAARRPIWVGMVVSLRLKSTSCCKSVKTPSAAPSIEPVAQSV